MSRPLGIRSTTIEFHRFGGEEGILRKDDRYIRTVGTEEIATEVAVRVDYKSFRRTLKRLRYAPNLSREEVQAAQKSLADEASHFLPQLSAARGELRQLDIVTHAAELWAFPFEASYATDPALLGERDTGVVVTRRIRAAFSENVPPWPSTPSILFVHAKIAHDLKRDLIEEHVDALKAALAPWGSGAALEEQSFLSVREVTSLDEFIAARDERAFSYIHVLAHGALVEDEEFADDAVWGLRLGGDGDDGVSPKAIAEALRPAADRPLVVTLAACDGANQEKPEFANYSLAQELHRSGIPVVLGSQFPLTKGGSVVLTQEFYRHLLAGNDVRFALHAARVALSVKCPEQHDWLSLVGYVRLPPEGYADHLAEFGLRAELGMLNAAQKEADRLSAHPERATPPDFLALEKRLRERLASLKARSESLSKADRTLQTEGHGLLGSANKRLAELLFVRATRFPAIDSQDGEASKEALRRALQSYRAAYQLNLSSHWTGLQKLSLEAVLNGEIARPAELEMVVLAAELERDAEPITSGRAKDYWSCGTIAEAILLSSIMAGAVDLTKAKEALSLLRERASQDPNDGGFAVASTRRQLERYTKWWTTGNGFFRGSKDLASGAAELVETLL